MARLHRPARPLVTGVVGLAVVALLGLVFLGVRLTHPGNARPSAGLTDLTDIEQLQARFNADSGSPRLVLLLSPT